MGYDRPWKTFTEQMELLKSRGMIITDEQAALRHLERIGYYRLSAYWYPFRRFVVSQDPATGRLTTLSSDAFVKNSRLSDATALYLFDKKLRLLVLDALERIEIALRVDLAYVLGRSSTFGHLCLDALHPSFAGRRNPHTGMSEYDTWRRKYDRLLQRSKEHFVTHYREKHGPDLPIWVAVEILDFGAVSQLISMMKVADQQVIAAKYGLADWKTFSTWLRSLNYLRNLAAHHSRVWNRNVVDQPKLPARGQIEWCDSFIGKADLIAKPFAIIAIARHLLKTISPTTLWHDRMRNHLLSFPTQHSDRGLSLSDMGVPSDWLHWWQTIKTPA